MKNTVIACLAVLASSTFAMSANAARSGGAIGGGEITSYDIYSCKAESLDPAVFSDVAEVTIAGERTFEGFLNPDMTVTIVLRDASGTNLQYLPTQTLPADFEPRELIAYQYAQTIPCEPNEVTAYFNVKRSKGTLFPAGNSTEVGSFKLSQCQYIVHAE